MDCGGKRSATPLLIMARHKNANWNLAEPKVTSWEEASVAVLMDIRDELQRLNALLYCGNFTAIPSTLRAIRRNTAKPRKTKDS